MPAYSVDGEIGRLSFATYSRVNAYWEGLYNTSREFFRPLHGAEKYRTEGFNELALIYGTTEASFRKTAALLNRVRHQEAGGTPSRTVRAHTEQEGRKIQDHLAHKVRTILQENGFTEEGVSQKVRGHALGDTSPLVSAEPLAELVRAFDIEERFKPAILKNPVPYEDPTAAVNISVDEVGAKKQKASREKRPADSPAKPKRAYVQNTVIHVEQAGASYILNGEGVLCGLRMVLAFLLHNHLLDHKFMFFVDGHSLYVSVVQFFSWHTNIAVILDWYHLKKKCKELLSMAVRGKEIRNTVLEKLLPLLWHGLGDHAITYLKNLPAAQIKNEQERSHLIEYFAKNRLMIPAYAVRSELGLRNSSNRGEKANDLLVAARQKHNGMSWSPSGSLALASVTALKKNQEYTKWFQEEQLQFELTS